MNTTTDYSKFRFINGNRPITKANVKNKIDSISSIGYIDGCSILVSKEMFEDTGFYYIIDGQHRFEALKKLKMPIPYSMVSGKPLELIKDLNSNQKSWQIKDYVKMYADNGTQCYIDLLQFIEKENIQPIVGINICFHALRGRDYAYIIKSGKGFNLAEDRYLILDFIKTSGLPFANTTNFIRACIRVFNKCNKEQINRLNKNILCVPQMAQFSQYLRAFENIINRYSRSTDRITL